MNRPITGTAKDRSGSRGWPTAPSLRTGRGLIGEGATLNGVFGMSKPVISCSSGALWARSSTVIRRIRTRALRSIVPIFRTS
jgi:hypothetical protein